MSNYQLDGYEDLDDAAPVDDERPRRGGRRRGLAAGVIMLAVGGFGAIVWHAYSTASRLPAAGEPPLIQAESSPFRIRPEQPGGLEVPHQDRLVLQQLDSAKAQAVIEQILPPPEAPLPRPVPPPQLEPELALNTLPADQPPAIETPASIDPTAQDADLRIVAGVPGLVAEPAVTVPAAVPKPPTVAPEPQAAPAPVPDPVPAAPAAAAPESGGYRIQMAAVRTTEAARAEWQRLQRRHPDLLNALQLQVHQADLGDRGIYYRVQAGPLSETAAASVCAGLKAQATDCIVVKP